MNKSNHSQIALRLNRRFFLIAAGSLADVKKFIDDKYQGAVIPTF